ncbi:secreted RxLR effector protein 78-like [Cryptomeria japonica]|uniref:secreted RxLR effector protein 78-like n=1 Tax=Cryptomeria japonica TaxID=3369 RepID=UPI0027DA1BE2|nr:secreted RxLR effector protein 78-like [Cryptomeria japonica]
MEGIIIAHEAIHTIRKAKVERMLIKLDIRKAYDMVDRDFLFQVLERFGFSSHWISWVKACIDGSWISVFVNGSPQGFFQSSRGLRPTNPLSPFLFILLAEVLGRFIQHLGSEDKWKGVLVAASVEAVTHQQFTDAAILFGDASFREACIIKKTLDVFL